MGKTSPPATAWIALCPHSAGLHCKKNAQETFCHVLFYIWNGKKLTQIYPYNQCTSLSAALGQGQCCNNCFPGQCVYVCVCVSRLGLQVQLQLESQSQLPWPWPRPDYAIVWLGVFSPCTLHPHPGNLLRLLRLCHYGSPCVGFQSRFWLLVADEDPRMSIGSGLDRKFENCFRRSSSRRSVRPGGVSLHSAGNAGSIQREELNKRFVRWAGRGWSWSRSRIGT